VDNFLIIYHQTKPQFKSTPAIQTHPLTPSLEKGGGIKTNKNNCFKIPLFKGERPQAKGV